MGDTCAAAPPKKKVSASERQRHVQATRARKDAAARESLLERQARKHSSSGATSGGDSGPIATLEAELANQSLSSAARYGLEKRLKTLKAAAARAARKKATGASSTASRTDPELVPPEPAGIQAPAPPSAATAALAPLNEHSSPVLARRWSSSAAGAPPSRSSQHQDRRGSASTERRGSSSLYAESRGSPYAERRSSGYTDHYADQQHRVSHKESHQSQARGRYGASAGGGSSFGGVGASAAPWGNSYSYDPTAPGDEDQEC